MNFKNLALTALKWLAIFFAAILSIKFIEQPPDLASTAVFIAYALAYACYKLKQIHDQLKSPPHV